MVAKATQESIDRANRNASRRTTPRTAIGSTDRFTREPPYYINDGRAPDTVTPAIDTRKPVRVQQPPLMPPTVATPEAIARINKSAANRPRSAATNTRQPVRGQQKPFLSPAARQSARPSARPFPAQGSMIPDSIRGNSLATYDTLQAPAIAIDPVRAQLQDAESSRGYTAGGPQVAIDPRQLELGRSRNATAPGVTTQYGENGQPIYSFGGGYNPSDRTLDPNYIGMKGDVPMYRQPDQGAGAFPNSPKGQLDKATYLQGIAKAENEGEGARLRAESARNVTGVAAAKAPFQASPQLNTMSDMIAIALTPEGRGNRKVLEAQYQMPFEDVVGLFREMQSDEYMGYMQERQGVLEKTPLYFQPEAQAYADGGEVFEEAMSTEAPVAAPQEQGATAGLDSGDYVIPVEALRFFGSKFFTNLIEKAENAEM